MSVERRGRGKIDVWGNLWTGWEPILLILLLANIATHECYENRKKILIYGRMRDDIVYSSIYRCWLPLYLWGKERKIGLWKGWDKIMLRYCCWYYLYVLLLSTITFMRKGRKDRFVERLGQDIAYTAADIVYMCCYWLPLYLWGKEGKIGL